MMSIFSVRIPLLLLTLSLGVSALSPTSALALPLDDEFSVSCIYTIDMDGLPEPASWKIDARVRPELHDYKVTTEILSGPFLGASETRSLEDFEVLRLGQDRIMDEEFRMAAKFLQIDLGQVKSVSHFKILDSRSAPVDLGAYKFNGKRGTLGVVVYNSDYGRFVRCDRLH